MLDKEIAELRADIRSLQEQFNNTAKQSVLHTSNGLKLRPWYILEDQIHEMKCRLYDLLREQAFYQEHTD